MVGWVHLLRMKAPLDPDRALAAIERNAAHQARLIDDLLDVSRALKGGLPMALAPVNIVEVTRNAMKAMQPVAGAKRVAFVLRIPQSAVWVNGDGGRLEQAVRNLLSNAVKFTPSGGRVDIGLSRHRGSIAIEVRDSGAGVDPAFLPHMFKPFRQGSGRGQRAGLGLGLSIVDEIVRRHGGSVTAESDGRDRGTCIRIVLPEAGVDIPASPPQGTTNRQAPVRTDEPAAAGEGDRPGRERSAEAPAAAVPPAEGPRPVVRASASRRAAALSAASDQLRRQAPDVTRAAH
jgi:signal transduction histidine kinase